MPRYPGGGTAHPVAGQIVEGAGVTRANEAKAVVVQVQHDGEDGSNLRRLIRHYHQCAVNQRHIVILIAQLARVARVDDHFLVGQNGRVGGWARLLDLHVEGVVWPNVGSVIDGCVACFCVAREFGICHLTCQTSAGVAVAGRAVLVVHQLHRAKLAVTLVLRVAVKRNA